MYHVSVQGVDERMINVYYYYYYYYYKLAGYTHFVGVITTEQIESLSAL